MCSLLHPHLLHVKDDHQPPPGDISETEQGTLKNELLDIIKNNRLTAFFQPIIDLMTGNVYAYEALCRIKGSTRFPTTDSLFQAARQTKLTSMLEKRCRQNVLNAVREEGTSHPIALNVCPSVLMKTRPGKKLPCLYKELLSMRDQIILELTERFDVQNYDRLLDAVNFYRQNGFRIALDDLGAGFTRLKLLSHIQPAIIKIDRFLIADIHKSTKKQMLLESIVSFCRKINALVVAEGIETESEMIAVMQMKVDMAQGYYLCPPLSGFHGCVPAVKSWILETNRKLRNPFEICGGNEIGSLINPVPAIESTMIVENVMQQFQWKEKTSALPVVENNRPVGILQKSKMFFKLGQPYGYALFCNKPVKKIMEKALVFEHHTPLEEVAKTVLQRTEESIYDSVMVVKNGAYAGIVEIYQLLSGITEQKIQLAIQANPLTGLPGNNLIQEEIERRLNQKQIFAILYIDLDNFKPFNDNFGFHKGDQVIRFLADVIRESLTKWDENGGFIGHVGGDDFVAVCRAGQVDCLCQSIINRFDRGIMMFHDAKTIEDGYFISQSRKGRQKHYPLLSVSIAVLTTENRTFQSYGHIVSIASEVKKHVKTLQGSVYYLDKRME